MPEFTGPKWTQRQVTGKDAEEDRVAKLYGLRVIEGEEKPGLGRSRIRYGGSSGYQAINLAYLWGARHILLLGYDYHVTEKKHFFGDHPQPLNAGTNYGQFLPHFDALAADLKAAGVEVVNCSRATALRCFLRTTMDAITC